MLSKKRDYIFSAIKYDHPVYRSFIKKEKKKLKMVFSGMEKKELKIFQKLITTQLNFILVGKAHGKRKKNFRQKI